MSTANFQVYGVRKLLHELRREGVHVAQCTVARLMSQMGLCGAVRSHRFQTTVPADMADRPLDLVEWDFTALRTRWRAFEGVEVATLERVWWLGHHRLMERLDYRPPVEHKERYYRAQENQVAVAVLT